MDDQLDRRTLAHRLADQIESGLNEGRWEDCLPGYRILAEEFGVSWRTSRNALTILEHRGILLPRESGRSRRIRSSSLSKRLSVENLLIITSSNTLHDIAELELLDAIILAWVKLGGRTHHARVDFRRHTRPGSSITRLVKSHGADALVIREPSKPWVDAARKLAIPVYFLGGDIPVSERGTVSGFGVSIIEMVTSSVKRLRKLGHRRILVPDEGSGTIIRDAILTGVENGFGEEPIPDPDLFCPVFPEMEPGAWQTYWLRSFSSFQPTAVIVRKESSYLSLISFCAKNGVRIPDDLSIICHSASENLRWCHPQPDRTTFPNPQAVSHFRRWIKNGFPLTGLKIFPVDFVEAGTVRSV